MGSGSIPADYNSWNDGKCDEYFYSAPIVALALQWFRDEKKLWFLYNICYNSGTGKWELKIADIAYKVSYDTYEAAESALLDELLRYLNESKANA